MPALKGSFLGFLTLDLQYLVSSFPQSNSKNKALASALDTGGPAFNAAASFSFLGGDCDFYSVMGEHPLRAYLSQSFQNYKLNAIDLCPSHRALPPIAAILSEAANGNRTVVGPPRPPIPIDPQVVLRHFDRKSSIVLVDGFHMEAAITLAKLAKAEKIPVVLDGGSWKPGMEQLLAQVDIAICSQDFRMPDGRTPQWEYFQGLGISALAITRGEAPILFFASHQQATIPVPTTEVVDTLGAGDVFHGAFCYYFAAGAKLSESLAAAAKVASFSCRYLGAKAWMQAWKPEGG